jgi:UDP-glucuronate decarboxylase
MHPQREDYRGNVNPHGIRSCYDEGKRIGETLMFDYFRKCGVKIKVIRIFNTYGPRMEKDDGRVISNFIVQALTNAPLTIYGDGSQTRSICYIDDLIEGIYAMLFSDESFRGPVNLGTDFEATVKEIGLKIISLANSKSEIVNEPLPSDDPLRRCADLNLAREKLGYVPKVGIEEGLLKTIEYFKGLI